jgi:hypothetical protein
LSGDRREGAIANRESSKIILFLGGSTTECNEVDEPFRFPAVVETLLRAAGANVRVENGGVRGHTSLDSINALLNRSGFRNADIIVLMQNINDRARLVAGLGYEAQLGTIAPTTSASIEKSFDFLCSNVWEWLSYRSNIVFVLREAFSDLDPWTGRKTIVIDRRTTAMIFVGIVRILGKIPVLMTQPLGVESEGQRLFNDMIRSAAGSEAVELIDLDSELGAHSGWAFLSDNLHLNNEGAAAVGANIACRLGSSLIKTETSINLDDLFPKKAPFTLKGCSIHK